MSATKKPSYQKCSQKGCRKKVLKDGLCETHAKKETSAKEITSKVTTAFKIKASSKDTSNQQINNAYIPDIPKDTIELSSLLESVDVLDHHKEETAASMKELPEIKETKQIKTKSPQKKRGIIGHIFFGLGTFCGTLKNLLRK